MICLNNSQSDATCETDSISLEIQRNDIYLNIKKKKN